MDELAFSDAVTLAARISKREISALELSDHYLERGERYNPDINAIICLPSTIVPTGPDEQGLPIGVQVVSHEMNDLQTIEFARMVHNEMGSFVPAPSFID